MYDVNQKEAWLIIGDCGQSAGREQWLTTEQYIIFLEIGVAFLKLNFGPPPEPERCVLDVAWFQYTEPFAAIGLGADGGISDEMRRYADRLTAALRGFDKSIDWKSIGCDSP